MKKVDVAIQSYKKPESMIYTLLSLKKYCGDLIDTIYINDDCSNDETVKYYESEKLQAYLAPIKLQVRVNKKPGKYTYTLMTKKLFFKKSFLEKMRLIGFSLINRLRWMSTTNDIRYQWAINVTNKKYIFIIHDDIKFYGNVLSLYLQYLESDEKMAIVGDLGGSSMCPYGPCGNNCSPEKILNSEFPCKEWPITGKKSILHAMLGRYKRNCRINEWCCMINVDIARKLVDRYGICFGNYEGGGDVGTYWFEKIIKLGYHFTDPLPREDLRKEYYLHWWQGHEGHEVWVDHGNGIAAYQKDYIVECIWKEFGYSIKE